MTRFQRIAETKEEVENTCRGPTLFPELLSHFRCAPTTTAFRLKQQFQAGYWTNFRPSLDYSGRQITPFYQPLPRKLACLEPLGRTPFLDNPVLDIP